MFSQVTQTDFIRQVLLHEIAGCRGEQHLASMRGAHDACGAVYVYADIAFGCSRWLTGMHAHTDAYSRVLRPEMIGKGTLRVRRCQHSIGRASKHDEESVPLRINLVAIPLLKDGSQHLTALGQHAGIAVT